MPITNPINEKVEAVAAMRQLASMMRQAQNYKEAENIAATEWQQWHDTVFGAWEKPFAEYHKELWKWGWDTQTEKFPPAFVAIWGRGAGKSTNIERLVIALAALGVVKYCIYFSSTQEKANKHVTDIGKHLESKRMAILYPDLASRRIGKYGDADGWRRDRLSCASGFTIDAAGLYSDVRGSKEAGQRPDLIILDDIDEKEDSPDVVQKKIDAIGQSIIPLGAENCKIVFVQNLIHEDSVMAKLYRGELEILTRRITSGPHPIIKDLVYTQVEKENGNFEYKIVSGEATWEGFDLETAEAWLNKEGPTVFLRERQHDVETNLQGIFGKIIFRRINKLELPIFERAEVWVDPAVTDTDRSDSHGISGGGVDIEGNLYVTHSWEGITSPGDSLNRAINIAHELNADFVGIETDQGGDTWITEYRVAVDKWEQEHPGCYAPSVKFAKAGGLGSKTHRASRMVFAYEMGRILHVVDESGHHILREKALRRFPLKKPHDLTDSGFWLWQSLVNTTIVPFSAVGGGQKTIIQIGRTA